MTIASELLHRHFQTLVADHAQWQTLIADDLVWERVHYVILTSSPLEDPTVVGWPKKVIFQPTSGGVPDGPDSRSLL